MIINLFNCFWLLISEEDGNPVSPSLTQVFSVDVACRGHVFYAASSFICNGVLISSRYFTVLHLCCKSREVCSE
jgi:hypothetical protein